MDKNIYIKEKLKEINMEDITWLCESLTEIYGKPQKASKEEKKLGNALAQLISLNIKANDK